MCSSDLASAIDFGCGYGDYLTYLRGAGHRGHYTGYDLVPEMIAAARKMHGTETCDWRVGHAIEEPADFVVASGIFNVKGDVPHDEWAAYMQRTVDEMAKAARKGIGFNVLSSVVAPERRRADLFFADPAEWLTYTMRRFGRRVCILQDSGLFEFTLIQFKD